MAKLTDTSHGILQTRWPAQCTVLLGAFISLAGVGCEKKSTIVLPPISVEVTPVVQQDIPVFGEWIGSLDGSVNADVRSQVTGYVLSIDYLEGSFVKAGDLLFSIDPRLFQATLDQANAALKEAQAQQQRTQIEVDRNTPLAKQGAISQQELDNAVQQNQAALASVDAAKANVDKATLDLQFTRVTSPVSGIAGLANAQKGNLVGPTTGALTTVSTVDPVKALFTISEQDYLRATESSPDRTSRAERRDELQFEMVFPNGKTYDQPGKFFAIQRQVDPKTGTLQVAAVFPNPQNLLRPGQFVRIRALLKTEKNQMVVPVRAVSELQSMYQLAVVGPGDKVQMRTVQVGPKLGKLQAITSGVSVGERVIVEGIQKVRDGLEVKVTTFVDASTSPTTAPTTLPAP